MATVVKRRPVLIGAVALALLIVLLFGGRAAWRLGHRLLGPPPPPRYTDASQIAAWMSVPYVSRVYRVPEPELYRALGIEREGRRMRRLHDIASETGRSEDEVVAVVRETVVAWQEAHPEPQRPPGAPPLPTPGELPPPRREDLPRPNRDDPKPAGWSPGLSGAPLAVTPAAWPGQLAR